MQRLQPTVVLCVVLILSSCTVASPGTVAPTNIPLPATVAVVETAVSTPVPPVSLPITPVPATSSSVPPSARPAPPADPGTGLAVTIDGAGTNDRLQIALTFDAGEDEGYAEAILDYLRDEGIRATFGRTGRWAEKHPDLVRRMVAEGHQLINHSYDHASFTGRSTGTAPLTSNQMLDELQRTEHIVSDITGGYVMMPYFRFPYGDATNRELAFIDEAGYYLNISWTCDTYGWKLGVTGADVAQRCTTAALPHEITLLHVGAAAAADFEGLPALVNYYRDASTLR